MKFTIRYVSLVVAVAIGAPWSQALAEPGDAAPPAKEGGAKDAGKASAPTASKGKDAKDAKGKDAKGKEKKKERTGPAGFLGGGYELEESQRTVAADRKRDEAIDQLKRIIPRLDAGAQKSELLFQLAELWIEKAKYVYFNEMTRFEGTTQKWSQCRDQKGEEACGKEPREDTHQSELYRDEALRLYDQILKDDPTYPRKDEVLFAYATNLYEKGRKRGQERPDLVLSGIQKYRDLVTQYPQSKFVGDAYIAMGEHFFTANELEKARKAYEGALESSKDDPRIYNFALYKLAWCDYNGGAFQDALQKFKKVVELSEVAKHKNEVALKSEALNDMILTWEKLQAIEEANAYYKTKASRKEARKFFGKLADRYFEDGGFDNAIKSYKILLTEDPNDRAAPQYQSNIVHSYDGLRQRDHVFQEMKVLVATYKPGSGWAVANKSDKSAIDAAYELAEEALRTLVTDYHQEAQKTKEVRTYRLARDIYKEYLDSFGQSEYAYNLNFYYAEILWTLEEWDKAADAYESVYSRDAKGGYSKVAAYNSLLCYEKLVDIDQGKAEKTELRDDQKVDEKKGKGTFTTKKKINKETITKDTKEQNLTKWEAKLVTACDRYAEIAGADKRLEKDELNVRYKAAFIFYDDKHYTEAAKRFGDIILKWPTDPQAQKAADLSLNILEVKEEWYELARLSRAFFENKKLAKPGDKWTTDLAKIMEGAQYKYVDLVVYHREKKTEQAAGLFREFVKEFPKSQYAAQALRYSLIVFNEAKKLDVAIAVGEQMLAEYPHPDFPKDNDFRSQTIWDLAKFYQLTSNFEKAATYYEQYYKEWEQKEGVREPEEAKPVEATAAPGKKAVKVAKAVTVKKKKVELKKIDDVIKAHQKEALQASDALYNAALWNEGLGNYPKAIAMYNEYIDKYSHMKDSISAATLAFNIVLIHEKEGDFAAEEKGLDQYLKDYEKTVPGSEAYYARYKRAIALQKLKRADESMKIFEVLFKEYGKLKPEEQKKVDVIDAFGHAAFMMMEPRWKAYTAIKFDNVKNLKKDLKRKLDATPAMIEDYTKVLQVGSADWGIAALTRIGMVNQDFANNFVNSPDPPQLNEEQLEMYRAELENRAFPLEEKAIEAYEKATAKSYELGIYNDYTLDAQNALNKFKPGEYPESRPVNYNGSTFFIGDPPALTIDQTFGTSGMAQKEIQKAPAKDDKKPAGKTDGKDDKKTLATDGKDGAGDDADGDQGEPEKPQPPQKQKLILDTKPSAQK